MLADNTRRASEPVLAEMAAKDEHIKKLEGVLQEVSGVAIVVRHAVLRVKTVICRSLQDRLKTTCARNRRVRGLPTATTPLVRAASRAHPLRSRVAASPCS
jgi:DICT domain-containing protein